MRYFFILFIPFSLFGQSDEEDFFSTEEQEYYENLSRDYSFKPTPVELATKNWFEHVKTIEARNRFKAPDINENILEKIGRDIDLLDSAKLQAIIKESQVVACEELNGTTAILYMDSKFDEFMWGEPGYWIELSANGKSSYYYTGLTRNYYINLYDSKLPVWKNDSTLQFRALNVRMIKPFIHPLEAPKYETIKDNLIIQLSLNQITKDSDGDGLQDIIEDKMMTNSNSNDSDGDGVLDVDDTNPRFESVRTNRTLMFAGLLDNYINDTLKIRDNKIINAKRPTQISKLKPRTYLIVSDDPDIQRIPIEYNQYIILTTHEFEEYKKKYPISFEDISISKTFKLDKYPNSFKVSISTNLGGEEYIVTELQNGYDITIYSTWIY
ncbi:MAG: hypothetical protein JXR03_15530 [Cyclobacteriaceae bacterium]